MAIANTILQVKKSGTPGNTPGSLNFGELALNYADGKLYYKNASGTITFLNTGGTGYSFTTINSNGSLILATSNTDTLSFTSSNGISITTNTISKTINIDGKIIFDKANTGGSGSSSGYLPNAVIYANTGGYLSNTSVFQFGSNNTLILAGNNPSTNTISGTLIVTGGVGISGALNATTKSFNIPHPTKPGKDLRYGSLEGPEYGVYVRGKLQGSNTIVLPEYWTKLINPDTITVQLTPIGKFQKLYVKDIKDNTVIIGDDGFFNKDINCYYTVFAERADVDKLDVEV